MKSAALENAERLNSKAVGSTQVTAETADTEQTRKPQTQLNNPNFSGVLVHTSLDSVGHAEV